MVRVVGCSRLLGALLALLLRLHSSEAKVQIRTLRVGPTPGGNRARGKPWLYLGKFGFDIGVGTYRVRAQLAQIGPRPPYNYSFETYLDEDWPAVDEIADPCNRSHLAKRSRSVIVGRRGEWGPWSNGSVRQNVRPHVWYFAISACNQTEPWDRGYKIKFEFAAQQPDTSHFSYEQKRMTTGNLAVLMFLTVFMFLYSKRVYAFFLSNGSVHPVIWTLTAVLILQYLAQTLHTGHLLVYRSNGSGVAALELLSEIMFMLSQIAQTSLLILIALGYTLLTQGLGELDLVIPLYMIVGVAHVILVLIVKLQDEASHRFHEYEGPAGWVLLVLRLVLFAWFIWAAQSTGAEGGFRLRSFLRRFTFAGSLYFLSYPAIFLIVDIFAPYLRAPIMASGQMVMQMASNVWLAWLFLNRGDYFKVSTLSSSLLPGGSPTNSIRYKDD